MSNASTRRHSTNLDSIPDNGARLRRKPDRSEIQEIKTPTLEVFGLFMKNYMYINDYSVARLATELGVTRGCVYNYLKGVRVPKRSTLELMCELFGVNAKKAESMFNHAVRA